MARTAWLIDGMAYVFRSFFGMRPMAAPDGTPINAVFGLGMTLQKFLVERKPELLGNRAYPDVVGLAAGEVLQGGPPVARIDRAQIHLQIVRCANR